MRSILKILGLLVFLSCSFSNEPKHSSKEINGKIELDKNKIIEDSLYLKTNYYDSINYVEIIKETNSKVFLNKKYKYKEIISKALLSKNEKAYSNASAWFNCSPDQTDMMFFSIAMAYKNKSSQAFFDIYLSYENYVIESDSAFVYFILFNLAKSYELKKDQHKVYVEIWDIGWNLKDSEYYLSKFCKQINKN